MGEGSYPPPPYAQEDESSLRGDTLRGMVREGNLEGKIALRPSVICVGFS